MNHWNTSGIGSAFAGTAALETLDIGLVTSIGTNFSYSYFGSLKYLIMRNTSTVATPSSSTLFYNGSPLYAGTGLILVPASMVSSYKADSHWSRYASMIESIESHPEICG